MSNRISILRSWLEEAEKDLQNLMEKIAPWLKEKENFEKKIKYIENLISLEEDTEEAEVISTTTIGKLTGKNAIEAYKELFKTDFKDRTFKEHEIREFANANGLSVRNNPLRASYGRSLLKDFVKDGLIVRVGRGEYRVSHTKPIRMRPISEEPTPPPPSDDISF